MACMVRSGLMKREVLISCPSHLAWTLWRITSAISASAAPPRNRPLTSASSMANRQLRTLPSEVRRMRLQLRQNGREIEAMMPTRPPSLSV